MLLKHCLYNEGKWQLDLHGRSTLRAFFTLCLLFYLPPLTSFSHSQRIDYDDRPVIIDQIMVSLPVTRLNTRTISSIMHPAVFLFASASHSNGVTLFESAVTMSFSLHSRIRDPHRGGLGDSENATGSTCNYYMRGQVAFF